MSNTNKKLSASSVSEVKPEINSTTKYQCINGSGFEENTGAITKDCNKCIFAVIRENESYCIKYGKKDYILAETNMKTVIIRNRFGKELTDEQKIVIFNLIMELTNRKSIELLNYDEKTLKFKTTEISAITVLLDLLIKNKLQFGIY